MLCPRLSGSFFKGLGNERFNYPYNGGQSCFLLVRFVNVLKWWCIPILQLILLSGALFV